MNTFKTAQGTARPAVPAIDRRVPARIETATFALG